ncbi:MAG: MATE family efflux transporter [Clostridiales bacterium]|nr:MATE family efflux transporter [Clostridiales bacterium]
MQKSLTKDMTNGSPTKLLLKFSLPMLIGNLFQQIYNMVDSIVVGKFVSSDALAAVGATGSLLFFINGLAFGLSGGISIVVSQYFGAKDYDKVRKAFATATYIVIGAAIIMGIIGFLSSRFLLELIDTPATIISDSEIYMKISFVGVIGIACYNGMSGILRALGDSTTPLIFLIVASILNVVLDLLFVIVFHWGVPGVAIATIISQIVSAIGCITYAYAKVKILRMPLSEFRPEKEIFIKCIRLGIPVALQNSLVSISLVALQGVINSYNEVVIAANTVVTRIEQLVLQPGASVGMALASFAGQNVGAGHDDRVKKGYKSASIIVIAFSIFMLPVMYFGGEYIMRLFTKQEDFEVVITGIQAIRITCFFYPFVSMIFITRNFLSGVGDIKVPMIMGISEVIFRISLAYLFTALIGFKGIWWATSVNWFFTSFVGIIRIASGKWKNKSIVNK